MNEEQIIDFVSAHYGPWKSTAMFMIGFGAGGFAAICLAFAVVWFQRKALMKGAKPLTPSVGS